VEQVAEIRPRLRLGRVGPKEVREVLPRLRRIPVEEEVGEQRLDARGLERQQRGLAVPQIEGTEQPNAERWRLHDDLPSH
jgi:hypothetical protein